MKVIVDTSIWSLLLRKNSKRVNAEDEKIKDIFQELLEDSRIQLIGPIRQELLSGISQSESYNKLKEHLRTFDDLEIKLEDYETAANFFNLCMKKGIQGSHIDFLICAVAFKHDLPIFTVDKDFTNYSKYIRINLINISEQK